MPLVLFCVPPVAAGAGGGTSSASAIAMAEGSVGGRAAISSAVYAG